MEITPYTRMVFYHETDRMDIVNHSNYIHMAEEARVDFMDKIGVGYNQMEEEGIMLPVLGVTCEYKHSLHFGEHLAVYSYITKYNGFKLELRYDILCVETGQLCAVATSSHCFTNTKIKPMRIRDKFPEMHAFFQKAMEVTYPEHYNFDLQNTAKGSHERISAFSRLPFFNVCLFLPADAEVRDTRTFS